MQWRGVRQTGLLPNFDIVLLTGSTLGNGPHPGWAAMVALDSLLPTNMTRLLLDPYAMAPALGSIANISPRAVVQTLETGAFIDLGMAFSVIGRARKGDIVVRGTIKPDGGQETTFEVPYGGISLIPLQPGQPGELNLQPNGVTVNMGNKKRGKISVTGGELGVIIDARGRPWRFPRSQDQRREWLKEWKQSMTEENAS